MQMEFPTVGRQGLSHGFQRGDANTTGDQNGRLRTIVERKSVPRLTGPKAQAQPIGFVNGARSTAALWIEPNDDFVNVAASGIAANGIGPGFKPPIAKSNGNL